MSLSVGLGLWQNEVPWPHRPEGGTDADALRTVRDQVQLRLLVLWRRFVDGPFFGFFVFGFFLFASARWFCAPVIFLRCRSCRYYRGGPPDLMSEWPFARTEAK